MRALPEKTLEHWVSREVARRFPSASLWWPSHGEDVTVDEIGGRPGKWFMLEVKTTEWEKPAGCNRLTVNLEQLDTYLCTGMPVFYVFPVPPWDDVLTTALPWLGRWRRGDLGNPMVGSQWFAHWTYVLSAREVAVLVRTSWPTHKTGTLFTTSASTRLRRVPRGARTLNQFLSLQARCGDRRSQAGLVVPTLAGRDGLISRSELSAELRDLVESGGRSNQSLSQFLPVLGEADGDLYQEFESEDLAQSLITVGRGSSRLMAVSIDAHDLAVI